MIIWLTQIRILKPNHPLNPKDRGQNTTVLIVVSYIVIDNDKPLSLVYVNSD